MAIIVHATPPKRSPRRKAPVPKLTTRIVTAGISRKPLPAARHVESEDPEAAARLRAFFQRMIRPPERAE